MKAHIGTITLSLSYSLLNQPKRLFWKCRETLVESIMELDFIVQDTLISDSLGYGYDYLYSILLQENFSV